MADNIFLIQGDDQLARLEAKSYDSEALLQTLLAKFPDLLAGEQIDSTSPRRWLLIKREMGIPAEEDASDRWSVDHLFIDQDAIPTLVEVKRSSDTRLRREVVGQMLEYAANAVHWPANTMRDKFEKNCADPEGRLTDFLGEDCDAEEFWEKAETNLKEGKIRMLFVADVIPPELQCIVEFLNKQMEYAEVLAVEIKQYVGENMKTLVPRVIGQTIEAATRKSSGAIRKVVNWDKQLFFSELGKNLDEHDMGIVQQLFDYCEASGGEIGWGNGAVGSFNFKWPAICRRSLFTVKTNGRLTLNFGWFHTTEVAEHFLNNGYLDLAQSLGFDLPAEPQNKWCDILIEEWGPKLDAFTAGLTKLLKQEATSSRDNP